ncbi:MAG: hypothetical protein H9789_03495 [Candidatus Paraprevotella stercoravium]|uniref:Uncharacterized protein n=1 Tax=Candidatus Paraprevotella stercoravium TaxID=2838725 RepID=A0A9E2L5C5_9BACT|nr:hypothetical protein [Candidatus Paraprevotella stercoravium]
MGDKDTGFSVTRGENHLNFVFLMSPVPAWAVSCAFGAACTGCRADWRDRITVGCTFFTDFLAAVFEGILKMLIFARNQSENHRLQSVRG